MCTCTHMHVWSFFLLVFFFAFSLFLFGIFWKFCSSILNGSYCFCIFFIFVFLLPETLNFQSSSAAFSASFITLPDNSIISKVFLADIKIPLVAQLLLAFVGYYELHSTNIHSKISCFLLWYELASIKLEALESLSLLTW